MTLWKNKILPFRRQDLKSLGILPGNYSNRSTQSVFFGKMDGDSQYLINLKEEQKLAKEAFNQDNRETFISIAFQTLAKMEKMKGPFHLNRKLMFNSKS